MERSKKGVLLGAGVYKCRGGKEMITPLGRQTTVMQAELVVIQAREYTMDTLILEKGL